MKMRINKIEYWLLLFIMPFIFSCAEAISNPVSLFELPKVATNSWIMSSMDPINAYKNIEPSNRIVLNMAKGEAEHFQLVLQTSKKGNLAVKRSNLQDNILLEVREIKSFEGVEDVLVPFNDSINTNTKVVKLWVTYESKIDAPIGEYQDVLKFTGSAGDILVGVTINIYNCMIPQTPSIPSLFGIVTSNVTPDLTGELLISKRKEYSDILLSKRATPYFANWLTGTMKVENFSSPYSWNDSRTMDYFADKRFSHLVLPSHNLTDLELGTLTQQIDSKGWNKKQVFYIWDEPTKMAEYDQIKKMSERIHNINNKAQVITTFYRGPEDGPRINDLFAVWDYLRGYTSLFCTGVWSLQNSESRSS